MMCLSLTPVACLLGFEIGIGQGPQPRTGLAGRLPDQKSSQTLAVWSIGPEEEGYEVPIIAQQLPSSETWPIKKPEMEKRSHTHTHTHTHARM